MKLEELRAKSENELKDLLKKVKDEVKSSVSDVFQGKSKDTSKTKKAKREVARILTVLKEKELIAEGNKDA